MDVDRLLVYVYERALHVDRLLVCVSMCMFMCVCTL